jgi:hypothetical protein
MYNNRRTNLPRLSLYKPEKGKDYTFLDRQILEMFTIGGTDVFVHKYLGPNNPLAADATADQPTYAGGVSASNIQDMLFLENRDRKYDTSIYEMRGIYNIQDIDFDLSAFGMFLQNDTVFMTVHINSSVKTLGRKPMNGDVIELPHLKDEYALDNNTMALKRFYVIDDINRAAEGFSPTWYPHLYRLKLKSLVDSQEFKEVLDLPAEEGSDTTLRDLLSTYETEMQINNAVVAQAESDAAKSGFDISHYYTLATNADGSVALQTADENRAGYQGYLLGTGESPNGAAFGQGIGFPATREDGDYFLRTDMSPKRLFKYDGTRWLKVQDDVRVTLSNTTDRNTQKGTFVNNTATSQIAGETITERQGLSKALRPKADN